MTPPRSAPHPSPSQGRPAPIPEPAHTHLSDEVLSRLADLIADRLYARLTAHRKTADKRAIVTSEEFQKIASMKGPARGKALEALLMARYRKEE